MKEAVYRVSGSQTQGRVDRLLSITPIKSSLSLPVTQPDTLEEESRRHKEAHGLPSLSLEKGNTGSKRVTAVSALLPAPWVSSSGLVSLYHTLLITAMTRPLSQRMPSSFSGALGHVLAEGAASQRSIPVKDFNLPASLSRSSDDYLFPS